MARKRDSVIAMVGVLTVTCLLAGLGLSFTYMKTKDAIAGAERNATLQSVRKVLPAFDGDPEEKTIVVNGDEKTFFIGRKNGTIVGIATMSAAIGYGGTVSILVGVDVDGKITGVELLQHQETPGLGAKAGNPEFLNQFKGKYIANMDGEVALVNYGGDIQGITSATITSRAVAHAATEALRVFMEKKDELL